MSKRGNNEGSVYKRVKDGRWVGVLNLGYGAGHRERLAFYGRTQAEVLDRLKAARHAHDDGLPLGSGRQTVGAYLTEWLSTTKTSIRPRTFTRYSEYVRVHAVPQIGRVKLAKLSPQHLQRLYATRLEAGSSPSTVAHLHAVLHRAFRQAERIGLVPRNVVALVDPPRIVRKEMRTLTPEQARAFLTATAEDRLGAVYVLAVSTGLRQGELLALRWRDVDLEGGTLAVRATLQRTAEGLVLAETKTARSRRQVMLTEAALTSLRRHRIAQAQERLRLGSAWEDKDLVFANEVGGAVEASNLLRRSFRPLLKAAGLPSIRFHDLRHTAATLLLGRGVHPKIVSEMLGHSQIAVTLDTYSHVTPSMQRDATRAMDEVLAR